MSFKCFLSYFIGIGSFMIAIRVTSNPILMILILSAGFCISQILCWVITQYCREKYYQDKLNHDTNDSLDFRW